MDGRQLAFRDATFDIAYSLSSIEHFGGLPGAVATIQEMARVLKPGGVLALATEYVLSGPRHPETFLPSEVRELITQPGLALVEPIDEAVYRRYTYTPVDLYENPYQAPHMVVRFGQTVFTTVMVFLRRI
jgi:ubiquinone/menaquinone biosynthesis C-methylase UbiE